MAFSHDIAATICDSNQVPRPSNCDESHTTQQSPINLSVCFPNGLWIKTTMDIRPTSVQACGIFRHGEHYTVEATHDCLYRRMLYDRLAHLVPVLIRKQDMCWFRTINKNQNRTDSCVFEGVKLELKFISAYTPECGFCFPRIAFGSERDRFAIESARSSGWEGWARREPSDAERAQVNRRGWEILYFVQPPATASIVSISLLKDELCHSLQINDAGRLVLTSGPFTWNSDFRDDGRQFYDTYFSQDLVVDSRHMTTPTGSALIYVLETSEL